MAKRDLDEDDVRIRPGRGTRPRSKERPQHLAAIPALVTTVDRGRITCMTDDGLSVMAMKARELGRKSVVVGDRVGLVGDVTGIEGSLARLVRIEERSTVLRRTADDDDPVERVLVANAEQLIIVAATAQPEPSIGLIDRCLVAAFDAGIRPILVFTKTDIAGAEQLTSLYQALDIEILAMNKTSDIGPLTSLIVGHVTAFVGHSGVGKSTLINRLVPDAARATGEVNEVTGRGRHTSSSAIAFRCENGWVIDTPGVRSFGLAHISQERVLSAFTDLSHVAENCPRDCQHDSEECALTSWAEQSEDNRSRVESLQRLLSSPRLSY